MLALCCNFLWPINPSSLSVQGLLNAKCASSATITMRENNARNTQSPSMQLQLQLQLGKCSHLTAENSRIRGFEGFQGFEWRLHFEGAFNISFRAAMRCFYYLCTADTATKLSRYPSPPPSPSGYTYTGRRSQNTSSVCCNFTFYCQVVSNAVFRERERERMLLAKMFA